MGSNIIIFKGSNDQGFKLSRLVMINLPRKSYSNFRALDTMFQLDATRGYRNRASMSGTTVSTVYYLYSVLATLGRYFIPPCSNTARLQPLTSNPKSTDLLHLTPLVIFASFSFLTDRHLLCKFLYLCVPSVFSIHVS